MFPIFCYKWNTNIFHVMYQEMNVDKCLCLYKSLLNIYFHLSTISVFVQPWNWLHQAERDKPRRVDRNKLQVIVIVTGAVVLKMNANFYKSWMHNDASAKFILKATDYNVSVKFYLIKIIHGSDSLTKILSIRFCGQVSKL